MKACKFSGRKVIFAAALAAAGAFCFGQNGSASGSSSSAAPTYPSISMPSSPSMPTISTPEIGNGFYSPAMSDFYQGQKNVPARSTDTSGAAADGNSNSGSTTASSGAASTSTEKTNLTGVSSGSLTSQYATANQLSNALTASDLNSMDSMGLLTNILGGSSSSSLYSSTTNTTDTVLLQQILADLEELKAKVNGTSGSSGAGSTSGVTTGTNSAASSSGANAAATSGAASSGPSILRFMINGMNILAGCHSIYFSKPEADGTFLLTGDRKYSAGGKTRLETFHLLFHASGTKNSTATYTVTPALTQDWENTSSYLYKLCQLKDLTASRTGNLVTLRCTNAGVITDLLISLE